ncbi:MAG: hypothetical protein IJY42_02130, partial [Clostridia bacterium]|nr:hypothetical protein [Clostridia bacterium]
QTMAELLRSVSETTALNAKELKTARDCSVGVANMVKDVFLNSRSLDHAGKDLMIRNYLNATAGVTEEAKEEAEA